jgi:phosphatidylglycerophosphate synthase
MFDHLLRLLKDRWLAPLSRMLGPRLSPTALSLIAFVIGIAAAVAAYRGAVVLSLAAWALNRLLDGLDGTHARVHTRQTDFGGYVDIMLDFIVYAAIPVALVARDPSLALAGVFLEATFFVNTASWMYLSAILEGRQSGAAARGELTTVTMPPGVVAGTETVVFYALFLTLAGWRAPLFWLMGSLVCVNIVQRLWWARRSL